MHKYYRRDDLNGEGYLDRTAYLAIKHTEGFNNTCDPHIYHYAKKKLQMLMGDFLVTPTIKEVDTLFSLETERAIDKYAVQIIIDHWNNG